MSEDLNEELDDLICSIQADYVIEHADIIGMERTNPEYNRLKGEYYDYVSQSLMWCAEYLFNVATAYVHAKELMVEETTPTQEMINKRLGIK